MRSLSISNDRSILRHKGAVCSQMLLIQFSFKARSCFGEENCVAVGERKDGKKLLFTDIGHMKMHWVLSSKTTPKILTWFFTWRGGVGILGCTVHVNCIPCEHKHWLTFWFFDCHFLLFSPSKNILVDLRSFWSIRILKDLGQEENVISVFYDQSIRFFLQQVGDKITKNEWSWGGPLVNSTCNIGISGNYLKIHSI